MLLMSMVHRVGRRPWVGAKLAQCHPFRQIEGRDCPRTSRPQVEARAAGGEALWHAPSDFNQLISLSLLLLLKRRRHNQLISDCRKRWGGEHFFKTFLTNTSYVHLLPVLPSKSYILPNRWRHSIAGSEAQGSVVDEIFNMLDHLLSCAPRQIHGSRDVIGFEVESGSALAGRTGAS